MTQTPAAEEKERFAETTKRWCRLEIEGLAHEGCVVFVEDDPKAHIDVKTRTTLLNGWDLNREPSSLWLLRRDRKEQYQIATRPRHTDANRDRTIFPAFGLSRLRLTHP